MPSAGDQRIAQKNTFGGFKSATIFSGQVAPSLLSCQSGTFAVGSDIMFQSGAGRLDYIMTLASVQSGLPITFYDAPAPVSGGPIPASGHRVVGTFPGTFNVNGGVVASGLLDGTLPAAGVPMQCSMVFLNGLCCNSRSGQPGFTINWTSEELR